MLALLASVFVAAFPVRGSVWRSLDSVVTIDQDTFKLSLLDCPCLCPAPQYQLNIANDTGAKIQHFPGPTWSNTFAGTSSKYLGTTSGPMLDCAAPVLVFTPDSLRRFIVHGKASDWAVWADSIQGASLRSLKARWRWVRIEKSIPWVRWVDTLDLRSPNSVMGLSILTMLQRTQLDSIVPSRRSCSVSLTLGNAANPWGYGMSNCMAPLGIANPTSSSMVPDGEIAAGTNIHVSSAMNTAGQPVTWRFLSGNLAIDSFVMAGLGSVEAQRALPAFRTGKPLAFGYELATGRRVPLAQPVAAGKYLLDGPDGLRMIVVR